MWIVYTISLTIMAIAKLICYNEDKGIHQKR